MYEQKELPELPIGDWRHTLDRHLSALDRHSSGLDSPHPTDPAQRDRARRAYYAQITFIDHQINRLIHTLWTYGCLENTCILFCADHGEMLYDHHLLNKGKPYDSSARVPFLIRFPRAWGYLSRATIDAPVELRDVLPTLCDIAGVPIPDSIEGQSLVPFCRGETPAWREYVHGEHAAGGLSNHWLTDGRTKYVWYSQTGLEQLFDLVDDPQELHNLADSQPERVHSWRGKLIRELADREEGYVRDSRLVVGRPPQAILAEAGLGR
jgi:arylsulfatase A-like enzyme